MKESVRVEMWGPDDDGVLRRNMSAPWCASATVGYAWGDPDGTWHWSVRWSNRICDTKPGIPLEGVVGSRRHALEMADATLASVGWPLPELRAVPAGVDPLTHYGKCASCFGVLRAMDVPALRSFDLRPVHARCDALEAIDAKHVGVTRIVGASPPPAPAQRPRDYAQPPAGASLERVDEAHPPSPVRVGDVYALDTSRSFEVAAFLLVDVTTPRAVGNHLVNGRAVGSVEWPLSLLDDPKRARLVTRGTGPDVRGLLPDEDPTLVHGLDDFHGGRLCPSGSGHASSYDGDVTCPVCRPAVDARRFSCTCCGLVADAPPEQGGRRFCARCSRFDPTDRQAPRLVRPTPAVETPHDRVRRILAADAAAHPKHAHAREVAVVAFCERARTYDSPPLDTSAHEVLAACHAYEQARAPFGRWGFLTRPQRRAILKAADDAAVLGTPTDHAMEQYERARGTA